MITPEESRRLVWREVEMRLRPTDCGLVVLANGTSSSHGDGPDPSALERRVTEELTDFCRWWLAGHGYQIVPGATPAKP